MSARIAAAVMCAALAGCTECGNVAYDLADKSVVPSRERAQYCYFAEKKPFGDEKLASDDAKQTGANWGIAKLIKAPVEDLSGNKVAEIDDLLVSPSGRIKTAVLTVTDATGSVQTITLAFKDLKRTVDANGNYTIRTTQLTKPKKKVPPEIDPVEDKPEKNAPAKDGKKKAEPPAEAH